jgi:hypothetical protein
MVKATRLKARQIRSAYSAKAAPPKRNPFLNRAFVVSRRAEKMDVIWHDRVGADQPCVGLSKCLEERFMNASVGQVVRRSQGTYG